MTLPLIAEAVVQDPTGGVHAPDKMGLVIAESILLVIVLAVYPWLAPFSASTSVAVMPSPDTARLLTDLPTTPRLEPIRRMPLPKSGNR